MLMMWVIVADVAKAGRKLEETGARRGGHAQPPARRPAPRASQLTPPPRRLFLCAAAHKLEERAKR